MKARASLSIFIAAMVLSIHPLAAQKTSGNPQSVAVQNDSSVFFKNNLFPTAGLITGFTLSGNYERILWQNPNRSLRALTLRVGVGKNWMETWFLIGNVKYELRTYTGMLGFLVGKRGSNFDFGMGATVLDGTTLTTSIFSYTETKGQYQDVNLAMNLGYRYQKPGDNFIFRCGLGWPDGLYVSLGLSF